MTDFSYQYIPYNRELFVFLSGEQMSIPHGHGDILVAHELLQSHERDFAGLRQPGGEGMSHGVRVTAYRLSPSSGARLSFLTTVWKQAGVFSNAVFFRGCWKIGSAGLRLYAWSIRIMSSGTRTKTRLPPFWMM